MILCENGLFSRLVVDKGRYFTHREFSFTIEGDIYLRYQSFQDRKEFEEALKTQNPHKIDIGAIYNIKVCAFDCALMHLTVHVEI